MKKCAELTMTVDLAKLPPEIRPFDELRSALQKAITATKPANLELTVRPIKVGTQPNTAQARVKAVGEQQASKAFLPWARRALRKAFKKLEAGLPPVPPGLILGPTARRSLFGRISRVETDVEENELTRIRLPGPSAATIRRMMSSEPQPLAPRALTAPSIRDVAPGVAKPQPPPNSHHGCPSEAAEGDSILHARKNRVDSADWRLVSISSILDLDFPRPLPKNRTKWSTEQAAAVARFEGTPVQVEGWLADIDKEGTEDCNCDACDDLDFHLWVVDSRDKVNDKTQALVAEITPRISKDNADSIHASVSKAKTPQKLRPIRVSGWLMLDQKHITKATAGNGNEGPHRRTPWEIHPIIKFEIQDPQTQEWTTIFEPEP